VGRKGKGRRWPLAKKKERFVTVISKLIFLHGIKQLKERVSIEKSSVGEKNFEGVDGSKAFGE